MPLNILCKSPKPNVSTANTLTDSKLRQRGQQDKLVDEFSEISLLKEAVYVKGAIKARLLHGKIRCKNYQRILPFQIEGMMEIKWRWMNWK